MGEAKVLLRIVACLAIIGCATEPTIPRSDPLIRGTIRESRELGRLLVQAGADSTSCDARTRAYVQFGSAKIVRRSGGAAPMTALQSGVVVSVWTSSEILDMCPGIVSASVAVIE